MLSTCLEYCLAPSDTPVWRKRTVVRRSRICILVRYIISMKSDIELPCIYLLTILIVIRGKCNKGSSCPMVHELEKLGNIRRNCF